MSVAATVSSECDGRAALARRSDGRAVARRQLSARVEQRSVKVERD
jgi:hypothetical protein